MSRFSRLKFKTFPYDHYFSYPSQVSYMNELCINSQKGKSSSILEVRERESTRNCLWCIWYDESYYSLKKDSTFFEFLILCSVSILGLPTNSDSQKHFLS